MLQSLLAIRPLQKHGPDSIQGTDYIATQMKGFLGQKLKIENDKSGETLILYTSENL